MDYFQYLALAILVGYVLWRIIDYPSPRRHLKRWQRYRNEDDHPNAALALERAAKLTRKRDPLETARYLNEAGGHWLKCERPSAAVNAFRESLIAWQDSAAPGDDYHDGIKAGLAEAEAALNAAGPEATGDESQRQTLLLVLKGIKHTILWGGVAAVYFAAGHYGISFWWMAVPIVAGVGVNFVIMSMENPSMFAGPE